MPYIGTSSAARKARQRFEAFAERLGIPKARQQKIWDRITSPCPPTKVVKSLYALVKAAVASKVPCPSTHVLIPKGYAKPTEQQVSRMGGKVDRRHLRVVGAEEAPVLRPRDVSQGKKVSAEGPARSRDIPQEGAGLPAEAKARPGLRPVPSPAPSGPPSPYPPGHPKHRPKTDKPKKRKRRSRFRPGEGRPPGTTVDPVTPATLPEIPKTGWPRKPKTKSPFRPGETPRIKDPDAPPRKPDTGKPPKTEPDTGKPPKKPDTGKPPKKPDTGKPPKTEPEVPPREKKKKKKEEEARC